MHKALSSTQDLELRAHWAQHFCILAAGLLENALKDIYDEYASRSASRAVASFVRSRLRRIQNPNATAFLEIVGSFDPDWRTKLEAFLEEDGRKEALDSIMANRHQIAHGKDCGITIGLLSTYLDRAIAVLEFVETQVRP